jgi:hypothetical protein
MANITGMTYADGTSYIIELEQLRDYVNTTLVTDINTILADVTAQAQAGVGNAEATVTGAMAEWNTRYDAWIEDFTGQVAALNESAVAGMVDAGTVRTKIVALIDAGITALRADLDERYPILDGDGLVSKANLPAALYPWTPNTALAAGTRLLSPAGDIVTALETHTTGTTYDPNRYTGNYGWVFAGHSQNDSPDYVQERLQLFYSPDGRTVLGGAGNPLYTPASTNNSLRDPVIKKVGDAWFMVYTANGGKDKTMEVAKSDDLINWTLVTTINVAAVPNLWMPWAPELVQDLDGSWIILFTAVENGPDPVLGIYRHTLYWTRATNTDLSSWTTPQNVFWDGSGAQGPAPIDAAPVRYNGKWWIFYGNDGVIHRAWADTLTGTWTTDKTGDWAQWASRAVTGTAHKGYEGPEVALLENGVVRVYLDEYTNPGAKPFGYVYSDSTDGMATWSRPVKVQTGPGFPTDSQVRHGTWLKLNSLTDMNRAIGAAYGTGQKMRHAEFYATGAVPGNTDWAGDFIYDTVLSQHGDEIAIKRPDSGQAVQVLRDGVYALHFHFTTSPQAETGGGWISIESPDGTIKWCTNDIPAGATAWSVSTGNRFMKAGTILKAVYHAKTSFVALGEVRLIITKMQ